MFRFLGAAIRRTWPCWLIAWGIVYAILFATAPSWDRIAQDTEFTFLPSDAPTRRGQALFERAFLDDKQLSNIVVIVSRAGEELRTGDWTFIEEVMKPAFMQLADEQGGLADKQSGDSAGKRTSIIADILIPSNSGSGILLVSDDRQAAMVVIQLTTELLEERNWPIIEKVQSLLWDWREKGQVPAGLNLDVNGSATVGRDMLVGQNQSARKTEFWTIVFVISILIVVYRGANPGHHPACLGVHGDADREKLAGPSGRGGRGCRVYRN